MERNGTSEALFGDAASASATGVDPAADPLVERLLGHAVDAPPSVWFMRQAGRSLPEYRKVREGIGMLDSCVRPDLVAEITVQPVRRHRVDAGIFFSDIVVPVMLAGLQVEIQPGRGPVFAHPVRTEADIDALPVLGEDFEAALEPIREAVRRSIAELGTTPLIGFAGAPFTVASYMVEGGPSRDHLRTRALMRSRPDLWDRLASWVAEVSGRFLHAQVLSGARAVQLFDSWVGSLSSATYRTHVQQHSAATLAHVADLPVPRIHFGVGAGHLLEDMHAAGATAMGVDHRLPLDEAVRRLPAGTAVQGNIDPAVLFTDEATRRAEVQDVLRRGRGAAGHVVNLGHGVPPETDPQVLTDLVAMIHEGVTEEGTRP
ncbi:uroporphyrinogen decarboxylase [Brachybacterium sp. EF45031]|uniref:uroporphyrinogen decarboxylase n=1 Tax=Brachybacterium sillae TaxID=2810536 RepID=UPI00217EB7B8|nr:uroporphyrinogen decarboxylase [Brachybacterium sillae]MCS6712093.1 uroporphyrinogen decarboxylase [Brachybacterium sillae]